MPSSKKHDRASRGLTFDGVREMALSLPGVEEGTSYGTPAFRVRKKLISRMHESGEALVLRIEDDQQNDLIEADPQSFFITDHYHGHPWILVRLSQADLGLLRELLESAWRRAASKRLLAEYDGNS